MGFYQYKICVFGDGAVGKTTLVNRYIKDKFITDLKMTIGVELYSKTIDLNGDTISLKIWDFAGQNENRFKHLLPNYVSGASGGIFMYDITRFITIKNIDNWMEMVDIGLQMWNTEIPLLMVGGKKDLESDRSVDIDYALDLAKAYDMYDLIECSSKTGENVHYVFQSIANKMIEYHSGKD